MDYKKTFLYNILFLFVDIVFWVITIFVFMSWRLIADKHIVTRYFFSFVCFALVWIVVGLIVNKYDIRKDSSLLKLYLKLFFVTSITIVYAGLFSYFVYPDLSFAVMLGVIIMTAIINVFVLILYSAYRYAVYGDNVTIEYQHRELIKCLRLPQKLDSESLFNLRQNILSFTNADTLNFFEESIELNSTNTLVLSVDEVINIQPFEPYYYDVFVNLMLQNNIRGINKMFCVINQKLPDNGIFVCRFKSNEEIKRQILANYFWGINYVFYLFHFIYRRILPKLIITKRLYFDITRGKKRSLSTTEILGRLYYCGFSVDEVRVVDGETYVISHRNKDPEKQIPKNYGLFVKLLRIGKNKKNFYVYKLRTMHPYSEYLQEYMFEKNNLQEGGKIKDDIRVTRLGKFLRKYWIDEFPMFINILKGEMKLVGVRPLSLQYFNLYSTELQNKRTEFKPGLLPPFYADMPKTLDEIQNSEMKYLIDCEKNGVFVTDFKYFWKILTNILFKKARSK